MLFQIGAYLLNRHTLIGIRLLQHKIGHEPLIAGRILACNHHHLFNGRILSQRRLNLTQLNAHTAYFYLVVNTAQVLNRAVWSVAGQVAGLVEPRTRLRAERVRNELLPGEFWPIEVAARQTNTADMQLTCYAYWHGL